MENWVPLLIAIFSLLSILFLLGVPVAFSFLFTNMVFAFIFWGGAAFSQMILGIYRSIAMFSLVPLPLFILMGEIIFLYEMALNMMDTLDKWIGRIPGRLSLMAVAGGVLFATLSGSSMASTAMLGQTLLPEMEKKGYKPQMTLGPIMGSGCLAGMMPLSALGIITATLAQISVGDFLITIIGPGLLMAVIYALYIIIRAVLQPDLAPRYDVEKVPLTTKIWLAIKYILPLTSIIIAIIAIITTGVATPSEAAAVGALICFILAFAYKGVRIDILKKAVVVTLKVTVMMFIILSGATGFSEILAYTGATQNLVELVTHLNLPPMGILIVMQLVLIVLGTFLESLAIMMITIPIYMPIIKTLGFDPFWFCAIFLINMELATISPPYGLVLFTMKGVAPHHTMTDVFKASIPFNILDAFALALVMAFPQIALFLPHLMKH
ncbi:MAG TPA: TRAP transporter large permease subunit [Syntrophorhabdales bacterium]|nr:TRAP transporter large permease subunit [Syntrophorhabdales bacterium]